MFTPIYKITKGLQKACLVGVLVALVAPSTVSAQTAAKKRDPFEALALGITEYNKGNKEQAVGALEYAAREGQPIAKWKLGRMYATGDGVKKDDRRAFTFFHDIAREHGNTGPNNKNAPYVASAFVSLGQYFERGLPDEGVRQNRSAAWKMYYTAGNVFRDPTALYHLFTMCEQGEGMACTKRDSMKWLRLSAKRGHLYAQAKLGHILFEGSDQYKRQPVEGLMWLAVARERTLHSPNASVNELHEAAFSTASPEQRRVATLRADEWMDKNCRSALNC